MKKIMAMTFVIVMIICMMGSSYAALSCNISVQADKTEVSKGGEFTINVSVSNIQSERGLIGLNATLDYDKESLELIDMQGKNGWETPEEGSSYNDANGKLVLTRSGLGKNAETIFTATFKVKENSKQNLIVGLRNIKVADGTKPASIAQAYQNITVTEGTVNPVPQPKPDDPEVVDPDQNPGTNTPGGSTSGSNTSGGNNSSLVGTTTNSSKNATNKVAKTNGNLPKAGVNSSAILVTFIGLISVVAIVLVLKIRLVNKKMGL